MFIAEQVTAQREGFAAATGDLLFVLDADLSVCPEDLPKFYEVARSGTAESRATSGRVAQASRITLMPTLSASAPTSLPTAPVGCLHIPTSRNPLPSGEQI